MIHPILNIRLYPRDYIISQVRLFNYAINTYTKGFIGLKDKISKKMWYKPVGCIVIVRRNIFT